MFFEACKNSEIMDSVISDIVNEFRFSLGDSTCFIEYNSFYGRELLETFSIFDKDTILSSLPNTDYDSCWGRKSQGTRTSNDENAYK